MFQFLAVQSLVDRESEVVACKEVWNVEASSSAEAFIASVFAGVESELFYSLAKEEEGDPDHVHHVEVHEAGRGQTQSTVLVEDAHWHAEDLSYYHFSIRVFYNLY